MSLNHPNRRRLPYRVRYGEHEAAFSDDEEAKTFAAKVSSRFQGTVDVVQTHGEDRGIVARYRSGRFRWAESGGPGFFDTPADKP